MYISGPEISRMLRAWRDRICIRIRSKRARERVCKDFASHYEAGDACAAAAAAARASPGIQAARVSVLDCLPWKLWALSSLWGIEIRRFIF